ncbi:MAG: ABC-2 family transporter protein [Candidatus Margulisbacteria bacterium]|nr:ABC-2 family transporter protein [Candidatus Margulisiibacteriota bacterium]
MDVYIEFAKKSFQKLLAYRLSMFFRLCGFLVSLLVVYYLWKTIFTASSTIEGYSFKMMLTYLVLSFAINALYDMPAEYALSDKIIRGEVAMDLIKPIDLQGVFFAESAGTSINQLITYNVAFLIITTSLFKIQPPASLLGFSFFITSLLLGFIIMTSIGFITASLCFWTNDAWGIFFVKTAMVTFFSGSLIPLHFLPNWLKEIAMMLPFHGIVYSPLSIYLGTVSFHKIIILLLNQAGWVIILIVTGRMIWQMGIRRVVIQGG